MNVEEYKSRVIAFLKSGAASDNHWSEVATCVLHASENDDSVPCIDAALESLAVRPAGTEREWRVAWKDGEKDRETITLATEEIADTCLDILTDNRIRGRRKQFSIDGGKTWRDVETVG